GCPARPPVPVGLPDRGPRPVRLGRRHADGAPAPGRLRVPAGLRTGDEETATMSRLRIFEDAHPDRPLLTTTDHAGMARELSAIGVDFEQWEASRPVKAGDAPEVVMAAYRADIDRLVAERGFRTVDVASIAPDHPQREAMRAKFLDEHFHKEDEVRFFVAGSGLFTLHVGDKVYE